MNRMNKLKVVIWLAMRYMDDGRSFLAPFRPGWRWHEGDLVFCKRWETEDADLSPVERTRRILYGTMQDLEEFLNFTMETVDDFATGFLPTLDTDLGVTELNEVLYKFYEKPMCSNVCVQKLSAMDENSKVKTLSNELTRRLLNSSESLGNKERVRVVDIYTQKLINSGYGVEQIRRNVINGIKGYERKLKESKEGGRRLHRTSAESSGKRAKKKLMDKT